jgi:predicted negative regulator of RcsB-dependent stress response
MIWLISTTLLLVIAVACWAWWHRREQRRAVEFRRAAESLDRADHPLIFIADHFWFPALGKYGEYSEDAGRMLACFADSLPEGFERLVARVEAARSQIAATGELDDDRSTALRALFEAIAERRGLDEHWRAALAAGELDWDIAAADEEDAGTPTRAQLDLLDDLRRKLDNSRSEAVLQDVDARIDEEGVQGVFRAALLDLRGRALLALDRPQEAVRDFEEAAKLAPEGGFESLVAADKGD